MKNWIYLPVLLLFFACEEAPNEPTAEKEEEEEPIEVDTTVPLSEKVGQMIMIGLGDKTGIDQDDSMMNVIKDGEVGGIILFEKNIADTNSFSSLRDMISFLQQAAPTELFISIDEEGGKVHRLKKKYGFIDMPSAAFLGNIDDVDTTKKYNRRLASLLDSLGINLNYSPVVDLAVNPRNPVIAGIDRSFGRSSGKVVRHALAVIEAHHEEGVKTIIKHFPGHGSSTTDSHKGVTDVTATWERGELKPYEELIASGDHDAIMTAHVINCNLDTSCLPATLSEPIMEGLLRNELGYEGVIFSDDMQMFAISKEYGKQNAIEMAIEAGVDVLVYGNNVPGSEHISAGEVHSMIMEMVESGEISRERINQLYIRIMRLKGKEI